MKGILESDDFEERDVSSFDEESRIDDLLELLLAPLVLEEDFVFGACTKIKMKMPECVNGEKVGEDLQASSFVLSCTLNNTTQNGDRPSLFAIQEDCDILGGTNYDTLDTRPVGFQC